MDHVMMPNPGLVIVSIELKFTAYIIGKAPLDWNI